MTHLFEYKFWAIQISAYIFFTIFVFFCMKATSIHYHSNISNKNTQISANSLLLILLFCFFLVLITFSSFRYTRHNIDEFESVSGHFYFIGGNDTYEYKVLYNLTKGVDYFTAKDLTHKEYLFVFICWIFSNLGLSFDLCLVFFNTLMFFTLVEFCKEFDLSKDSFIPIVALLALYIASFNTLRWSLNLLLTVYFAKNYVKQNLKKCFLIMLLHIGFQFSAIVYIMPIFGSILLEKHRKLAYFFVLTCAFVCYAPALLDISPLLILLGRRGQADVYGNTPTTWLIFYTVYILNILFIRKTFFKDNKNKYIFYMILFLIPPTFMELTFGLAYRFAYYAHPILYMQTIYLRQENRKQGLIGLGFTAMELFLLLCIVLKFYFGGLIESSGVPYMFNKNFFWE